MNIQTVPVIAIDGPTASGKGTVASLLAQSLGFHYLDSGAIYRVLGIWALQSQLNPDAADDLARLESQSATLPVEFIGSTILLGDADVSDDIRTEEAGVMASRLAAFPKIREGLLQRQRDFRVAPGLVADGRDMGSVVFPDSVLKVFLTASAEVRAQRRYRQLEDRGVKADYDRLVADLQERDRRDSERAVAPLKACADARVLDTSAMGIDEVIATLKTWASEVL